MIGWLLLLLAIPAAAQPVACPRTLRTAQEAMDVPAGMEAEEGEQDWSRLSHVEFYAGPPVPAGRGLSPTRYALAPASQTTQGRSVVAVWDFSELRGEAVWLGCHYHETRMHLLLRLPERVTRCSVAYGRGESGAVLLGAVQAIACE